MRHLRLPMPVVLTLTAVIDGAAILAATSAWLVLAGSLGTAWLIAAMVTLPLIAWGAGEALLGRRTEAFPGSILRQEPQDLHQGEQAISGRQARQSLDQRSCRCGDAGGEPHPPARVREQGRQSAQFREGSDDTDCPRFCEPGDKRNMGLLIVNG